MLWRLKHKSSCSNYKYTYDLVAISVHSYSVVNSDSFASAISAQEITKNVYLLAECSGCQWSLGPTYGTMSEESQSHDGSKKSPSLAAASDTGLPAEECGAQVDASTHTSQTNVAQMTASSAPTEGNKWKCDTCTYENFPLSRKCTMCRSHKPSLGEDIFKLQDGASALPAQDDCGAEAIAERLKPLRISSPLGQASASSITKWPCATCTYENWPRALKCAMCGASAPTHRPHPAHPTHPVAVGINDICNSQPPSQHELDSSGRRSKRRNNTDWIWLQACLGVVEGDARCVDAYLAAGGDPARALTAPEVALLNRASAFDPGHTLVHLAIRFQRQEILSTLLSRISGGGPGLKRSPSYVAPDLATAIRRHIAGCVRHKKGSFPCRYINEFCTFSLPSEIEELPAAIQEQLFSELLDRDAQQTLEADPPLINWSLHLTVTLGSRLYALWNRSAGDCLPDAVCQAAYGVSDRANVLRTALADTLHHANRRYICLTYVVYGLVFLAPDAKPTGGYKFQSFSPRCRRALGVLLMASSSSHSTSPYGDTQ
ncbi:jg8874 [Pararge aegeria aegeria]|uniref:ubiquitinyl hydrolase 1 n=1 Tax=Pararge aegeria aegeria TaxID=348720 RepID=A0A8S4R5K0_9NEOP|nr:jg8874 [Pararge aegeria aegeria]